MASSIHAHFPAMTAATGSSCFCVPWHKQFLQTQSRNQAKPYTDADLAHDMNALTVQQREVLAEEIHGVSDVMEESPSLVRDKIREMQDALTNIPSSTTYRAAWDRAVYLRPSLGTDVDHFLLFLRARRFDAFDAANWLLRYYDSKQKLWGDDKLIHKLTWADLTPQDEAYIRNGVYLVIPKSHSVGETTGAAANSIPKIAYFRVSRWGNLKSDPLFLTRVMVYIFMDEMTRNVAMQKEGAVAVIDLRGEHWESTKMQILQFAGYCIPIFERSPHRTTAIHFLMKESQVAGFVQGVQAVLPRDWRVRVRLHVGSWMEIQYSLRTFGIDLPVDCSLDHETEGPFSRQAIDRQIRSFIESDELWRRSEEKYQRFTSTIAMYPNPQDIITGRNRKVTATWPGNIHLKKTIDSHTPLYLQLDDRREKTKMSKKIVKILQAEHKARFLVRNAELSYWEALDYEEARLKVGQDLRDESRKLLNQMKKTLNSL